MSTIQRAIEIATEAHRGQTDRYGQPYIDHAMRVMLRGKNRHERIVGVLHETVDKSDWTFGDLEREGFPPAIIGALKALAPRQMEGPARYLSRIQENELAVRVKIYDLLDMMDLRNIPYLALQHLSYLEEVMGMYRRLSPNYEEAVARAIRNIPERSGRPWTEEEDMQVETLFWEGVGIHKIARTLRRGKGAVWNRIHKLRTYNKYGMDRFQWVELPVQELEDPDSGDFEVDF